MNERVSILMILLILFLVIIVDMVVSTVSREFLLSRENTFSGGLIRPYFHVMPIRFSDRKIISIYRQGEGTVSKDDSVYGLPATTFAGLLSFIDYGKITCENKNYPVFQIKLASEKQQLLNMMIRNEKGEKGEIDKKILDNILQEVWQGYSKEEFSESLNEWFDIDKRAKIYYESFDDGDRKLIIIGEFSIDITDGLSEDDRFLFDTMATSMLDFVYLGNFDPDERDRFFRESEPENSDKKDDESIIFSQLVTNKKAREEYIETRIAENHTPPKWVKELFLDKIGVNLKVSIIEETKE